MAADPFPAERLSALAAQTASGNVVLFIGAGFSRDSEGNSAARLIRRLMARFMGMCDALEAWVNEADKKEKIQDIRKTFFSVHNIHDRLKRPEFIADLVEKYYPFNDWMISAFSELTDVLFGASSPTSVPSNIDNLNKEIIKQESFWLERVGSEKGGSRNKDPESKDSSPLKPPDFKRLAPLGRDERGKILFLEAMGFACPDVMAGDIVNRDRSQVAKSFQSRLRPRHHVIARLAREGLSPILITTNFDLLLEGAYRLAGFELWEQAGPGPDTPIPTRHPYFARIAKPQDFSRQRDGGRVAAIVKIHGCADAFRACLNDLNPENWPTFLRSIVFTFREVQNWRDDAWSRDLIYTLLRTRTVAFSGYSTADPVLHDTIRNAYEEMARRNQGATKDASCAKAPAFFFGPPNSKEFYGLETLRSASRAVGVEHPRLTDHPNYLRFQFAGSGNFPDTDDYFVWLFHRVYRRRQLEALKAELGGIVNFLLGHPVPNRQLQAIYSAFSALIRRENAAARMWRADPKCRLSFAATSNWTRHFHPALLRDVAIAHRAACQGRHAGPMEALRDGYWYYPANENYGWTAWGAVVELALRRAAEQFAGDVTWKDVSLKTGVGGVALHPSDFAYEPTVLIGDPGRPRPPISLRLVMGNLGRGAGKCVSGTALARKNIDWRLDFKSLPWRPAAANSPTADDVWKWANGDLPNLSEHLTFKRP